MKIELDILKKETNAMEEKEEEKLKELEEKWIEYMEALRNSI